MFRLQVLALKQDSRLWMNEYCLFCLMVKEHFYILLHYYVRFLIITARETDVPDSVLYARIFFIICVILWWYQFQMFRHKCDVMSKSTSYNFHVIVTSINHDIFFSTSPFLNVLISKPTSSFWLSTLWKPWV